MSRRRLSFSAGDFVSLTRRSTEEWRVRIVADIEREAKRALVGDFPDNWLNDDDAIAELYLGRAKQKPLVSALLNVLRACLVVRETGWLDDHIRDWLAIALAEVADQQNTRDARDRAAAYARQERARQQAPDKTYALKLAAQMKRRNSAISNREIARRLEHEIGTPAATIRGWLAAR